MRAQTSLISIFAAGGAIALLLAGWNGGLAAPTPATVFADRSPTAVPVDTELVIAVDVSNSMDPEEQELQREGKWRHLWRVAGRYANISVFDVASNDELHAILSGLPLFPFMEITVTPLARHPSAVD